MFTLKFVESLEVLMFPRPLILVSLSMLVCSTLLTSCTDPQQKLWEGAQAGNLKTVTSALEAGAEVDFITEDGWTPLSISASNGKLEVVELLVKNGATVDLPDKDGKTALMRARNVVIARYLVESGADVTLRDSKGKNPLHHASDGAVTRFLIEQGAEMNSRDSAGITPLMDVASNGYARVVEVLVDNGVNVSAKDNDGMTAIDYAEKSGYEAISQMLAERNAHPSSLQMMKDLLGHKLYYRGRSKWRFDHLGEFVGKKLEILSKSESSDGMTRTYRVILHLYAPPRSFLQGHITHHAESNITYRRIDGHWKVVSAQLIRDRTSIGKG